jgi:hypothetical protein
MTYLATILTMLIALCQDFFRDADLFGNLDLPPKLKAFLKGFAKNGWLHFVVIILSACLALFSTCGITRT